MNLNKNIGIILRNYKDPINKENLQKIKYFCKNNNRKLFLANDLKLAVNLGLDGAYLPSFNKELGLKKFSLKKNFIVMGSAHNYKEISFKQNQGVDIIFLSPLFVTKNYRKKLDVVRFNILSRFSKKKIIALGGINNKNKKKLKIANAYGFSGISYFEH